MPDESLWLGFPLCSLRVKLSFRRTDKLEEGEDFAVLTALSGACVHASRPAEDFSWERAYKSVNYKNGPKERGFLSIWSAGGVETWKPLVVKWRKFRCCPPISLHICAYSPVYKFYFTRCTDVGILRYNLEREKIKKCSSEKIMQIFGSSKMIL